MLFVDVVIGMAGAVCLYVDEGIAEENLIDGDLTFQNRRKVYAQRYFFRGDERVLVKRRAAFYRYIVHGKCKSREFLKERQPGTGKRYIAIDVLVSPLVYFSVHCLWKEIGDEEHQEQEDANDNARYLQWLQCHLFQGEVHNKELECGKTNLLISIVYRPVLCYDVL